MVTLAVEGQTDVAVAKKILAHAGHQVGPEYVQHGKGKLDKKISNYNAAARLERWFVLRDLDLAPCAPSIIAALLPAPERHMCFRVAVRAVEAWLMADHETFSEFFAIASSKLAQNPDLILDPKAELISLMGSSRRRDIREGMIPAVGMSAKVGPGYSALVAEYSSSYWRPDSAAKRSPSLAKCIRAVSAL